MNLPHVRVRRLANIGVFGKQRLFEIECTPAGHDSPAWTERTSKPYGLLKPILGWDEAALVEWRASQAWHGGTGPWVTGLTGEASDGRDQ
jgi:hypothetical protein